MIKRLIAYPILLITVCFGILYAAKEPAPVPILKGGLVSGQQPEDDDEAAPKIVQRLLQTLSPDRQRFDQALADLDADWHPGYRYELLDMSQFYDAYRAAKVKALLAKKTGQDAGMSFKDWMTWSWNEKYEPDPNYADFKRYFLRKIDPRFESYFTNTADAKIRLDEIRWGGVIRDGIPPLDKPKMITAKEATYLADSDVVFGVDLNGDARCYPKRILAWHEMFKDTIGGESVCGVY